MGLFSMNYNRPGPGVSKDEPEKNAFIKFWELYFRKFFNLVKLNLMFAVPVIICFFLVFFARIPLQQSILSIFTSYIWVLVFPFLAGLTYVCRNYAREEHAFLFSDFVDAIKENWKAFLLNGVISITLYLLLSVAITYYQAQAASNPIFYIPLVFSAVVSCLFIWAEFYIPVMIITFDLKLRQIYKNALIFSILGIWRNLILTVIGVAFWLVTEFLGYNWPLIYLIGFIFVALFFLFSFTGFLVNFTVYPVIKRYMISSGEKQEEPAKNREDEADFKDSLY